MRNVLLRVIRFPLTRIIIAVVFVLGAMIAVQLLLALLRNSIFGRGVPTGLGFGLFSALVTVVVVDLAYRGYVRLVERRPVEELDLRGAPAEFGRGALLGAGLFAATIGTLAALGDYRVLGVNPWTAPVAALGPALVSGYFEEVFVRGILFRITEDGLGSWLALVISSLFFGFAHFWNPGATVVSSVAITVEAGVLLGVAFMLTRRLWFPIGLHAAWNFTQGGVFGVAVSGLKQQGLLRGELTGPEALTGGSFGPEASVLAVVLCPVAAVALTVLAVRRGNVRPPFWARRPSKPPTEDLLAGGESAS